MHFKIILNLLLLCSITYEQDLEENKLLDSRRKFLRKKLENNVTATRIESLDKILAKGSIIIIDDIIHHFVKKHPKFKKVMKFEKEFRNIIAMNGVKYVYNRDKIWRTWEKVSEQNNIKIVNYRFETPIDCMSNCGFRGIWLIEVHTPPCPYEIFSTNENLACALNISTYHKLTKCSKHLLSVLTATCDNPIKTTWIIEKKFGEKNRAFPVAICGKRMYCKITTLYKISVDYISFQIINQNNQVIFSRVMKNGGKNYACVENCGQYDPATRKILKNETPMKMNMLKKVQKREDKRRYSPNLGLLIHKFKAMKTTHRPSCKNLQHNHTVDFHEYESDNDGSYYFV